MSDEQQKVDEVAMAALAETGCPGQTAPGQMVLQHLAKLGERLIHKDIGTMFAVVAYTFNCSSPTPHQHGHMDFATVGEQQLTPLQRQAVLISLEQVVAKLKKGLT